MESQSETEYSAGAVVWVKLGASWWPGEVWPREDLPPDILRSFRKPPIAVVKFFQEESFEYVKNHNNIYEYNCSRKREFIRKGLDLHRSKLSHMEKFPADVREAERRCGGDEGLPDSEEFAPRPRSTYAGLFGTPKARIAGSPPKIRKASLNSTRSDDDTSPRIVQKFLKGKSDYRAHILLQEIKKDDIAECPVGESPSPGSRPTPTPAAYSCHVCGFTASRLNVMVLHTKSHSVGLPTPPSTVVPARPRFRPRPRLDLSPVRPSPDKKPRGRPRKMATPTAPPVPPPAPRRKPKELKRPRTDVEIKNSLLADWSEDSNESMDILTSLKLGESPRTEINEPSLEASDTLVELPQSRSRERSSCFDFDDDEDPPIETIGRKIPRSSNRSDDSRKRTADDREISPRREGSGEDPDQELEREPEQELEREVRSLLEETALPELPTVPSTVLPTTSLQNLPDDSSLEKQSGKLIFKTKSFFRTRHSRSQDAIEKYVADNTGADKPLTYMEETEELEGSRTASDASPVPEIAETGTILDMDIDRSESPTVSRVPIELSPEIKETKTALEKSKCPPEPPQEIISLNESVETSQTLSEQVSINTTDLTDVLHAEVSSEVDLPTERDLQVAEALINLPESAIRETSVAFSMEDESHRGLTESKIADNDNFNAAESLVQMSETLQSAAVSSDCIVPEIDSSPATGRLETPESFQIPEEPVKYKPKPPLKILSTKIISPSGKEKILNFDVGAGSPTKVAAVTPQKRKIIIRRTIAPGKVDKSEADRFGDTSHERLILSSRAAGDGGVQTFTIEQPAGASPERDHRPSIKRVEKYFPGKQKVISKPRNAIITSTGKIIQAGEHSNEDDGLFDINSMPIVLSEEILPSEVSSGTSEKPPPKLDSGSAIADSLETKSPKLIVGNVNLNRASSQIKKYNIESPQLKQSNIILKPVTEKTMSPNILSKSKKGPKHVLVVGKNATEQQKLTIEPKETQKIYSPAKIVKQSPELSSQNSSKREKFIIMSSPGSLGKFINNKSQKLTVSSPQGPIVIPKQRDGFQAVQVPKSKPTTTRIIQNRTDLVAPKGNKIMILTNAQGVQSKFILTPEHQKTLAKGQAGPTGSQTIFTSKGTILTAVPPTKSEGLTMVGKATTGTRLQPTPPTPSAAPARLLLQHRAPLLGHRTVLTARPNQTILTSKGQLITQSSSPVTVHSRLSDVTTTTTVLTPPTRLRVLKTTQPQKIIGKMKRGLVLQTTPSTGKLAVNTSSPGRFVTPERTAVLRTKSEDSTLFVPPKSGTVMHLTAAQFEHLQKTGQLVQKVTPRSGTVQTQKIILQKLATDAGERIGLERKVQYSPSVPPLALIPQADGPARKRRKLREPPSESTRDLHSTTEPTTLITSAAHTASPTVDLDNLDDLIPATAISTRKVEVSRQSQGEPQLGPDGSHSSMSDDGTTIVQSSNPGDGQLLAVPGENFGGPPNTFYLCMEENGNLTPVDNRPLILENNQLVPMVPTEEPAPLAPPEPPPIETADVQPNLGGEQQILIDHQTLLTLLSSESQTMMTSDGQPVILQGNAHQLLAALAANPEIVSLLSSGQQILLNTGGSDGSQLLTVPPPASNHDILATALANTDVFQPEALVSDSPVGSEMESLGPDFRNMNASVSVHSNVSETSSTLNQPIMSPLELPTKKRSGNDLCVPDNSEMIPQNLEDSLAVIGVTAPVVPTSLDLPITITDPRIAPKTTTSLNLACGLVYRSPGLGSDSVLTSVGDVTSFSAETYDTSEPVLKSTKNSPQSGSSLLLDRSTSRRNIGRDKDKKVVLHLSVGSSSIATESLTDKHPGLFNKLPASSMPCLDDSSSDSFVDENTQRLANTIHSKIYSPISMPLLTEDVVDEPEQEDTAESRFDLLKSAEISLASEMESVTTKETNGEQSQCPISLENVNDITTHKLEEENQINLPQLDEQFLIDSELPKNTESADLLKNGDTYSLHEDNPISVKKIPGHITTSTEKSHESTSIDSEESASKELSSNSSLENLKSTDYSESLVEYVESSTEYVEPSTEYSEQSTDYVEQSTEYVEPSTEYVEPSSEYVEQSTEYVGPSAEFVDSSTEYVEPSEYVEHSTEYVEPPTKYVEESTEYIEQSTEYAEPLSEYEEPSTEFAVPSTESYSEQSTQYMDEYIEPPIQDYRQDFVNPSSESISKNYPEPSASPNQNTVRITTSDSDEKSLQEVCPETSDISVTYDPSRSSSHDSDNTQAEAAISYDNCNYESETLLTCNQNPCKGESATVSDRLRGYEPATDNDRLTNYELAAESDQLPEYEPEASASLPSLHTVNDYNGQERISDPVAEHISNELEALNNSDTIPKQNHQYECHPLGMEDSVQDDSFKNDMDIAPSSVASEACPSPASESSSDASTEIPIQPGISVSQQLVRDFSMLGEDGPEDKEPLDSRLAEDTRVSPDKFKSDDER